jgi:integrase
MGRRRRIDDPNIWPLTEHSSGYIGNRDGIATLRYGPTFRRSLDLPFIEKNRKRAERLGNQLVTEYKRERAGLPSALGSVGVRQPTMTVRAAWLEFAKAQIAGSPKGSELRYKHSFDAFYPKTEGSIPLDLDHLHAYLAKRMAILRTEYANNTLAKFVMCQRSFFNYCRDRKFLDGNPLTLIKTPKIKKKEKVIIYTELEEQRIEAWFHKRIEEEYKVCEKNRTAAQYANLWRFLSYSACRIGESLSLVWAEWTTDRETENFVDMQAGRVVLNRTKNGEERKLPIDSLPGLRDVLERQQQYAEANGGYVFHVRDIQKPAKAFKKCVAALAKDPDPTKRIVIQTGPRPLHVFRATAEARWKRLGWSKEIITTLAGHSEDVYERDYETKFTYDELVERIPPTPNNVIQYREVV